MELFFSQIIGFDMHKISQERSFLAQFLAIFRKNFDLFDIMSTKNYDSDIDLRSLVHFCLNKHNM